jgi:FkbM family methyltransferase
MKRKGGLGWVPSFVRPEPTAEERYWEQIAPKLEGKVVYDVGAFQGMLTMLFARHAGRVVAFEPNTRTYKRLMENLSLNDCCRNTEVRKCGVGSVRESREFVVNTAMMGTSTLDEAASERMLRDPRASTETIDITTIDYEIENGAPPPHFIKIDVEGYELQVLRGAVNTLKHYSPTLFMEMHGDTPTIKQQKVRAIVEFLWDLGYRKIRHIESNTWITTDNTAVAAEGHLDCVRR